MVLGKVIGTLVATRKEPTLEGLKLLVVRACDVDGQVPASGGTMVVAADAVGAGLGEVVLYASGSSARQTRRDPEPTGRRHDHGDRRRGRGRRRAPLQVRRTSRWRPSTSAGSRRSSPGCWSGWAAAAPAPAPARPAPPAGGGSRGVNVPRGTRTASTPTPRPRRPAARRGLRGQRAPAGRHPMQDDRRDAARPRRGTTRSCRATRSRSRGWAATRTSWSRTSWSSTRPRASRSCGRSRSPATTA